MQVLLAALAEFQKAQCFFLIALEIAAQIVIRKGFLDSANLSELVNTYALINDISCSGCLPVAFTLFCLYRAGMESWYLSILTLCALGISTATGFLTSNFQPSAGAIQRLSQTTSKFASCGYQNPMAFCQESNYGGFVGISGNPNIPSVYSLVVIVMITAIQGVKYLKVHHEMFVQNIATWFQLRLRSIGLEKIYTRLKAASPKRRRDYAVSYFYFALWFVFVCLFCVFFDGLVFFLPQAGIYDGNGSQGHAIDTSNWSFGQIVAITVWAGPLFEYLHLSIRK